MAQVNLKIGTSTVTLSESTDLASLATGPINLNVISDIGNFEALLDQPVGQISNFSVQPQITLQQNGSWAAAGQAGALTLSIQAGASGTLKLIQPGAELFKFSADADGNPGPSQLAQVDGINRPYICIGFKVSYSIKGGAKFSFGSLGVNGSASEGHTFEVDNYFACDPAMPLKQAIQSAFGAFALPFNPNSAAAMPDGAFLDHIFTGNVALDAGLSYGFSIAGASLGEIKRSFSSPIANGGIAPSIKFGASLGITFQADDAYRVIISRQKSASKNLLNLCVSKADKKALGLNFGVTFTASLGADFNLENALDKVIEKAAAPVLQDLPAAGRDAALAAFKKSLSQDQIEKFLQEAQDEINSLISKVNNQTAGFTVAYERDRANTQLANYVFDCNVPEALTIGYPAAMRCDMRAAMQSAGVELEPGSFLQEELSQSVTVSFQFFNLFKVTDKTSFFKNLKTIYAGRGVFRVVYDVGVDWINIFNTRSEELKVFFEATANTSDEATFQNATITLNFFMADSKDAKRAALTAAVLEALNDDALKSIAQRITDTVTVTVRIDAHAFGALSFDPVKIGGKLNPGPHNNDQRNYEKFAAMVNLLRTDVPFAEGRFQSYADWVIYNQTANDREGSTRPPDRSEHGNLNVSSVWPLQELPVTDVSERTFISIDFEAGRQFMNLCEFLDRLDDSRLDEPATSTAFNDLLDSLASIVQKTSSALTWYSRSSFLALFQLLSAQVADIQSSEPGKPLQISFDLKSSAAFSAAGGRIS